MQVLRDSRVLIVEDKHGDERPMFITDGWMPEQARKYAKELGLTPLYIINIRDSRHERND